MAYSYAKSYTEDLRKYGTPFSPPKALNSMEQERVTSPSLMKSVVSSSKRGQESVYFSPPRDCCSHWREHLRDFKEASDTDDVELVEPNESRPDKTFVDSDIEDDEVQESVIEEDERVHISPTTAAPYKWVCSLRMRFSNGKRYIGTGFYCTVTGSDRLAVVTCAHNLYSSKRGGYAEKVEVIQGRDRFQAPFGSLKAAAYNLRVPDEYKRRPTADNDYGLIVFEKRPPNGEPAGFGFRSLTDEELQGRIVQTCGYPGDKPGGTLWMAGGLVNRLKTNRIYYSNDTYGGQSGSPVWTWHGWNFMLVGIHGYGLKVRNSARRVNNEMIRQIERWVYEF